MKKNNGMHHRRSPARAFSGLFAKVGCAFALGVAALAAPTAWADTGWPAAQETINNHSTWIYTPASTMANGKRALVIALHGCDQSNTQLKESGNLNTAAEAKGAVIAVPWVGSKPWPVYASSNCWNYDGASDGSGHIAELVLLTKNLIARSNFNIDANHVYIVGLSAGGAIALDAACQSPELFAGVSALAGPSVGSAQSSAISDGGGIGYTPAQAASKCKALAGTAKLPHLDTQIANIAYGEMDRNAEKLGCKYSAGDTKCPGQYILVSKKWSTINADMYKSIYGTTTLGTPVVVPESTGETSTATVANNAALTKPVLSLTRIYNVGHAWPAGSGKPNSVASGGVWMAQSGMDYTSYVVGWLIDNNRRKADGKPVVTACSAFVASTAASSVTVTGNGKDDDGTIASYKVVIDGPKLVTDAAAGSGTSFTKEYSGLPNGPYTATVTATDNDAKVSKDPCIKSFHIGPIDLLPPTDLKTGSITSNSMTVSWTNASGATSYSVTRTAGDLVPVVTSVPSGTGTTTSFAVTGLEAGTEYKFAVKSVNGPGTSDSPDPTVTAKTLGACTDYPASNKAHVTADRAVAYWGIAYAKGSYQYMGWNNTYVSTTLLETKPGYFIIGKCAAK